MKQFLLMLLCALSLSAAAQYMITERGYFYSPSGFTCKHGHIYTADMTTMVKAGWYSRDDWDQHYLVDRVIEIPSGAEVIPSHLLYNPTGEPATGCNWLYAVIIPKSVQWIATDAFLMPQVVFFSGETQVESAPVVKSDDARELARFDVAGNKLSAPEPGVNIVLMSDGTAHKVLVK